MSNLTSSERLALLNAFETKFMKLFENYQRGSIAELERLKKLTAILKKMPEFSG